MSKRLRGVLALSLLGCALHAAAAASSCVDELGALDGSFSGWEHRPLSKLKTDTRYTLGTEGELRVVHAVAEASASSYVKVFSKPQALPARLSWRWRTDAAVPGADSRDKDKEDAPLRVIVAFDGDLKTLPAEEQRRFRRAKTLFGQSLPFAILMYTWTDKVANDSVIPSAHTSQVRMIAVSGSSPGTWQSLSRDVAADYRKVWGKAPGKLLGVAVMSDTDNTGATAAGDYAALRAECGQ